MSDTHVTVEGETFDGLALKYYNDEKLASTIIQANPEYCDVLIFEAGVSLMIPETPSGAFPETLPPWRRDK